MEVLRRIARTFLIMAPVIAVFPCLASAAWRDFIPTPYENGADLDVFSSYETESNKVDGGGRKWSDLFVKEKLTLHSNGYSFHPRFITYRLSLSAGFKHEDYETNYIESAGWKTASGLEYDAILDTLPEHPYNLRLFSRRIEPLFKQQFATYSNNVEKSKGAAFRYRKKPYFFRARYVEDSIESSLNSSTMELFGLDGVYFKEFRNGKVFSMNAAYTRTSFDASSQGTGNSDEYSIGNAIDLNAVNLNSSLSGTGMRQENPQGGGGIKTDQFGWLERLSANLPLNFRSDLSYSYSRTDFTTGAAGTIPESAVNNTGKRIELSLSHVLYKSLQSRFGFLNDSLSSSGGDTKTRSHSLSFNYTKNIPWGRLLAGLNLGGATTDTSGSPMVTNEPHTTPVPGSFFLNVQDVDPATLRIYLKSPLPPFDLILLEENVHYTVGLLGNTLLISIVNLPSQFSLPGTFDLLASYSRISSEFRSRTDTLAYNVGFELFNNMLNPYYSYIRTKTRILAGDFPGEPPETTQHAIGVLFQREPLRARAEYQRQESNVSPYSQWKAEVTFTKNLTETIRAYLSTTYVGTSYYRSATLPGGDGYSVRTGMVSGNLQKRLPAKNLFLSAGGSYSFFRGPVEGSTYSADASLQWKIAKLTFGLGATASSSESESPGTVVLGTKRTHQYYYLNAKRKLF